MYRTLFTRNARLLAPGQSRLFTSGSLYQKTATETAKDGLKAVDRAVSDTIVKGIDKTGSYFFHCRTTYGS